MNLPVAFHAYVDAIMDAAVDLCLKDGPPPTVYGIWIGRTAQPFPWHVTHAQEALDVLRGRGEPVVGVAMLADGLGKRSPTPLDPDTDLVALRDAGDSQVVDALIVEALLRDGSYHAAIQPYGMEGGWHELGPRSYSDRRLPVHSVFIDAAHELLHLLDKEQ